MALRYPPEPRRDRQPHGPTATQPHGPTATPHHHPSERAGIRRRLLRQARLFEDPRAYAAGVLDALEAVTDSMGEVRHSGPRRRIEPTRTGGPPSG